jgi:hypothetical protein
MVDLRCSPESTWPTNLQVKVKDMKKYLEERGVSTAGLYEKSDIEKKVREVWAQTHGGAS